MKIMSAINKTLGALEVAEDDIEIKTTDDPNTIQVCITYQIKNTPYRNYYKEDITNGGNG